MLRGTSSIALQGLAPAFFDLRPRKAKQATNGALLCSIVKQESGRRFLMLFGD